MKYCTVKDHLHNYKYYLNGYFFTELLNMAMVRNVEVMLGQTLNYSVLNSVLFLQCHTFLNFLT
jgi:hypothetical protein